MNELGDRRYTERQKPRIVAGRSGENSGEKREACNMI